MIAVDPVRKFERRSEGRCEVLYKKFAIFDFAAGANQSIVTAVSNRSILVLGAILQSNNAAAGSIQFQSSSAGIILSGLMWPPPIGLPPFVLELKDEGYFYTSLGEGLFCDVTTQPVSGTIFYLEIIP